MLIGTIWSLARCTIFAVHLNSKKYLRMNIKTLSSKSTFREFRAVFGRMVKWTLSFVAIREKQTFFFLTLD
jgi:hypothetical protein